MASASQTPNAKVGKKRSASCGSRPAVAATAEGLSETGQNLLAELLVVKQVIANDDAGNGLSVELDQMAQTERSAAFDALADATEQMLIVRAEKEARAAVAGTAASSTGTGAEVRLRGPSDFVEISD